MNDAKKKQKESDHRWFLAALWVSPFPRGKELLGLSLLCIFVNKTDFIFLGTQCVPITVLQPMVIM